MNAESVKARLKNFAKDTGHTFQEALTYYGLERTIYRISVSEYAEHFVLKGGIFLYAIFDRKYERATTDVDFLARRISNSFCTSLLQYFRNMIKYMQKRWHMKILLAAVNAKYIHSNLAVYSLKAAAGPLGAQVEIGEYTINQKTDQIMKEIYKKQPDVVAFSCYIWNRRMVEELIRELPKVLPGVPLWAGGPEVTWDARGFLEACPEAAGVMRGEGEETFCRLATYYIEGDGSLSGIRGLTYRGEDGQLHETEPAELPDLDRIPFACPDPEAFGNRIVYYESSRGCPFRCSYCLSSIERKVRFRNLELVKKELLFFLEARVPQVKFVDRTFNLDHGRTVKLWSWILEHDNGVTNFHFEIGADLITEEELEIMSRMRPGLIQLEIGVQSTNADTIRGIDRTMDLERLKAVVRKLGDFHNIHRHLDLIAGLPYEDLESFRRSFDEVYALEPEQLQLGFLKVLKGSKMYERAAGYGILCRREPPYEVLRTDWLSYEDLLLLKGVEEMVETYYNSRQFTQTLKELLKRYGSPFDLFHELAVYYEDRGYDQVSHSRMARYEILREFLKQRGWMSRVFDQCMTYDLYVREKLKSRPSFVADLSPYRQQLKAYEKDYGKRVHVEIFLCEEGPRFVLFDYERRDPLTKEAHVEVLH